MVRAVVEIDFIASIQPQSYGTEMSLEAQARIEHATHVLRPQAVNRACEGPNRGRRRVEAKIDESALERQEGANRAVAALNFRAEQAVQDAKIAAHNGHSGGVETFCENLVEV